MLTTKEIYKREDEELAPYAMKSKDTLGRVHAEEEHPYRSCYQRDRDRIIYSAAFRRLQYKTQVFVNYEGDYYRTRLTHTLEVAQLARSIAHALRLNEELTEAIALAHDIGHTPFGHSGEDALREIMKEHNGFEHNRHGLRVVDVLEERYPGFKGLNLTWEVREGIIKHTTIHDAPEFKEFKPDIMPTLEAQVVERADEIAYDNHDLDDGLRSGLIKEEVLADVLLWRKACDSAIEGSPQLKEESRKRKYQVVRVLIDMQVTDLIRTSELRLKEFKISSCAGVRKCPEKIISFGKEMKGLRKTFEDFLLNNLYHHYRVMRMSNKAYRFVRQLFDIFLKKPEQLPPQEQVRIEEEGKYRVICDYIAGMTDRYAQDEYRKLFEPYERV